MPRIVLVADDSPTIQKRATGILKGDGYEVETVSNGVAAIKRLAQLRPFVVLADVCMPGRDGYEVCEYVKNSPELANVPVLLVASDMEPYDSAKGTAVKADGIIKKPFEQRELLAAMAKFAALHEEVAPEISEAPTTVAAPFPSQEVAMEAPSISPAEPADAAPTIVQHGQPDFSQHAGGLAFDEPVAPNTHDAIPTSPEMTYDVQEPLPAAFPAQDFAMAVPHADDRAVAAFTSAGTLTPEAVNDTHIPAFLEGFGTPSPEPALIEDAAAHSHSSDGEFHTPFFSQEAPVAESAPAEHHEEAVQPAADDGSVALEPQFIEEHDAEPEGSHGNSHDHPHPHPHDHSHDHTHEHEHVHAPLGATNLDSFSLDDAAAGQVKFASSTPEVVYAPVDEEAAALAEALPAIDAHAPQFTELEAQTEPENAEASTGTMPEVVYASAGPVTAEPENSNSEVSTVEPVAEASLPQPDHSAQPAEVGEFEINKNADSAVTPALEHSIALEAAPAEEPGEVTVHHGDVSEAWLEPSAEGAAQIGTEPQAEHEVAEAAVAPFTLDETPLSESSVLASAPELALSPTPVPESAAVPDASIEAATAAEPRAPEPPPSPRPIPDHELISMTVRKVVAKMAPSFLSADAVNDLVEKLTDEVAAEFGSSAKPTAN